MTLCILTLGKTLTLAASVFTLSWTHSVQKTAWEEDWRVTPSGLEIVEARIKGSGAGMESPPDAVLENGWWVYAPKLLPQDELVLAASGATGEGWKVCAGDKCLTIGAQPGQPAILRACP